MSDIEWWKTAVFYQIYPRSFKDSTGNGIGDLNGITEKLEYISDLGIDGIWISPFFKSPMADFGYDVSDYRSVDPLFGSNADFENLIKKSHKYGIKVIVDMVLSHTSHEHPWFVESRQDRTNPKADWYVWCDEIPNNWVSVFGGGAWEWDETRQQYYLHNFLKEQPDLNYHNPDVRDAMIEECRYWLERDVDGFRLDVINYIYHDKELRNNPPRDPHKDGFANQQEIENPYSMQWHVHDKSRPEALDFVERLRALMDEYPNKMALAEISADDRVKLAAEYTKGDKRFHTAYSISLMGGTEITSSIVKNNVVDFFDASDQSWPSWAFSNHDVIRVASRWGEEISNKEAFAIMLNKLLLSLKGTVFLYQGDELGLSEADIPKEKLQDPWGIYYWPDWKGRDGCRTPMPWVADAPQAGFSDSEETWLPVPDDHKIRAVNTQETDQHSVLNQTRDFIAWRKTKAVLQYGDIEFHDTKDEKLLAFDRILNGQKICCIFNLSEDQKEFKGESVNPLGVKFFEAKFIED